MRLLVVLLACAGVSLCCTTLIAGRAATVDGSVMASHSDDDDSDADSRVMVVPAADHSPGSLRPVYWDTENYPRYVGYDRGPGYAPVDGQKLSVPIGYIPQVKHTFAYTEATYAIMNEHQVSIGESTCSAIFGTNAAGHGGTALLSIDELSRLALERARTAREAVQIMGDLAVEYGFYGEDSFEGDAESLMVIDPQEGFIFHILTDDTNTSAIWVAQRVPDDHFGVVANMFTIRAVNLSDSFNFLGSRNMYTIAEKYGLWNSTQGLLDFTAVYSNGEYAHKYYSGRRMWGAYLLLAPSANVSDTYTDLRYDPYPTFLPPDNKVGVTDFARVHRFYYQGTKYDMTQGLAAGPWGNPDRYDTITSVVGNWERSIGLFRTGFTHITQGRSWLPNEQGGIVWFAPHASATSCFVPYSAGVTSLAPQYAIANPNVLDRASIYWAHRYVFNVAKIKYSYMMDDIRALQSALETASLALVAQLDAAYPKQNDDLTGAYIANANTVLAAFWSLPDFLVAKYADGYINDGASLSYPDWWLRAVGYPNGPPPPPPENHRRPSERQS